MSTVSPCEGGFPLRLPQRRFAGKFDETNFPELCFPRFVPKLLRIFVNAKQSPLSGCSCCSIVGRRPVLRIRAFADLIMGIENRNGARERERQHTMETAQILSESHRDFPIGHRNQSHRSEREFQCVFPIWYISQTADTHIQNISCIVGNFAKIYSFTLHVVLSTLCVHDLRIMMTMVMILSGQK